MIDLRSDTLTKPTPEMRQAIAQAEVGDDIFGEDPTLNKLEATVAQLLGKESALYVPSGTMGNQLGIHAHCQPGDEFLCEAECHIFHYEQAAYAQLFGIATQAVASTAGLPTIEQLAPRIRQSDLHAPRTKLLCLENTHNRMGGLVLDYDALVEVCAWAKEAGLARHLDGARLWNASAATGRPPAEWAQHFDTVSVCFSKGLGAPVGSALAGPASLITEARRTRKALGGAMRQAGILAAGALYALEHHQTRLTNDHQNADLLRRAIDQTEAFSQPSFQQEKAPLPTNLVLFDIDLTWGTAQQACAKLAEQKILMLPLNPQRVRAVTHLGLSAAEVQQAADVLRQIG